MKRVTLVLALGLLIFTVPQTKVGIVYDAVANCTSAADGKAEAAKFQGRLAFRFTCQGWQEHGQEIREKMTVKFDEDRFTSRNDG